MTWAGAVAAQEHHALSTPACAAGQQMVDKFAVASASDVVEIVEVVHGLVCDFGMEGVVADINERRYNYGAAR